MKALIFVNKGLEQAASRESNGKASLLQGTEGVACAAFHSLKDACEYCYQTQIASSVMLVLSESEDHKGLGVPEWAQGFIPDSLKIKIINKTQVEDLEKDLGKSLGYPVDLKNPDILLYIHRLDKYYLCLDLSGDLSKRDYRLFNSPMSLKGTTAFGVLMLCGYKQGESLLDPYCNSGTIAIEAALYSSKIPIKRYSKDFPFMKLDIDIKNKEEIFSKAESMINEEKLDITAADPLLRNITAAKKNAKIAGVGKLIDFRRIDIDWMDIKHEEKAFDHIITFIPGSSKHRDEKRLSKNFSNFFYQSEYVIKDSGTLAVLCLAKDLLKDSASPYFELKQEKEVYSASQRMFLLIFRKRMK